MLFKTNRYGRVLFRFLENFDVLFGVICGKRILCENQKTGGTNLKETIKSKQWWTESMDFNYSERNEGSVDASVPGKLNIKDKKYGYKVIIRIKYAHFR